MAKKDYSSHKSPTSVAKRPTLNIDQKDKRAYDKKTAAIWAARSGSDQKTVNLIGPGLSGVALDAQVNSGVKFGPSPDGPKTDFSKLAPILSPSGTLTQIPGTVDVAPLAITNFSAAWSGSNLVFTFTFDPNDNANSYFQQFVFLMQPTGWSSQYTWIPKQSEIVINSTTQTVTFSLADNNNVFNSPVTSFSLIEVSTWDVFGNKSAYVPLSPIPVYVNDLPTPVINVSAINSGYSVSYTKPTQSDFYGIEIDEFVSSSTTEPTGTYTTVYNGTLNPANVISADLNKRWVKARFLSSTNTYTAYSEPAVPVTPIAPVAVDTTVPTEVTVGTPYWSNNNIIIPYTLPASNAGTRFIITLTAPNSQVGYFYINTDGTSNLNQNATITPNSLYSEFGAYFTSFTGLFQSVSAVNVNSPGVSFSVPTLTSSLSSYVPVATVSNVVDGYTVQFNFGTSGATEGQVYQFFTSPTWISSIEDVPDYLDSTYSSGGVSGSTTIVVNSLTAENGNFALPSGTLPYAGYQITGTGIPANTWITSISGTGPTYTLTLNNQLTQQASGQYHLQAKVYDGIGPANIFLNYYSTIYTFVTFYNVFGIRSENSAIYIVNPINPAQSVITNSIQIGSGGSIYVGGSATTGSRIVLGPSGIKGPDGTSSYSGIFAFDYGSTSSSAASTAIITNPGASSYTFETTNAKIADWTISTNKIESTLVSGITKYTGLSASNTSYAFWAGATSSGNSDSTAPFSVTPLGAVSASNITITGGSLSVGANFSVNNSGTLNASNATISGTIHAGGGDFTGNVLLNGGSLYSPKVANTTPGPNVPGSIFNSQGLASYNSNGGYSAMLTTPLSDKSTFVSTAANLGGWLIDSTSIHDSASSVIIDSGTGTTYTTPVVLLNSGTNYVGMTTGVGDNIVFWAGQSYTNRSTSKFLVKGDGTLTASGATITGILTSGLTSTNSGTNGYYFNNTTGGFIAGAANSYIQYTGGTNPITLAASASRYTVNTSGGPSADGATSYFATSKISLDPVYGTQIIGIPIQGDMDNTNNTYVSTNPYLGVSGFGTLPRQRTVVENPTNGVLELGFGIYYANSQYHNSTPTGTSGYVGDIWIQY